MGKKKILRACLFGLIFLAGLFIFIGGIGNFEAFAYIATVQFLSAIAAILYPILGALLALFGGMGLIFVLVKGEEAGAKTEKFVVHFNRLLFLDLFIVWVFSFFGSLVASLLSGGSGQSAANALFALLNNWRVNKKYKFVEPKEVEINKHPNFCKKSYEKYFRESLQIIDQFNN